MEEIKVSIIIPMYNAVKYISECIESIINQTYKNIEIIIVDDGSKDESAKIIKEYQEKHKNIKYIFQENKGAPSARNLGIIESTGQYIMFLDSDDVLKKNSINEMISIAVQKKSDLVLGCFEEITEEGKKIKEVIEHTEISEYIEENVFECGIFLPYPGNKLYNSSIIKQNNIKFSNVKIGQDLNFYIKYLAYCKKVVTIPNIIAQYRIVEGSISRTYTLKVLDIVRTIDDIKKTYQELNLMEIYKKYFSIVELVHYNGQLSKTNFYKDKIDRQIITLFMKKYASKLIFDKDTYYGYYTKRFVIKFWLKIRFSFIYNSNLACKIFSYIKKKRDLNKL